MPKIKTIDVQAKEWRDKVNGNSYFAGKVILNYGMPSEKTFVMPFQYGYGEQYLHEAFQLFTVAGIKKDTGSITRFCRENRITLRHSIAKNCLKKELKEF